MIEAMNWKLEHVIFALVDSLYKENRKIIADTVIADYLVHHRDHIYDNTERSIRNEIGMRRWPKV